MDQNEGRSKNKYAPRKLNSMIIVEQMNDRKIIDMRTYLLMKSAGNQKEAEQE